MRLPCSEATRAAWKPAEPPPMTARSKSYMIGRALVSADRDAGERTYVNPRNTASGALRQLDPKLTAARPISLLCYAILDAEDLKLISQWDVLQTLAALGFLRRATSTPRSPVLPSGRLDRHLVTILWVAAMKIASAFVMAMRPCVRAGHCTPAARDGA